jgi:hypothetical protein
VEAYRLTTCHANLDILAALHHNMVREINKSNILEAEIARQVVVTPSSVARAVALLEEEKIARR